MMKRRSTTYRLNKLDWTIFVICSIASAVMFFLFYRDLNSFSIKQSEEPIAKIYFKRNTAQRKFVDSDIWEVLTSSSDVYDGDRIRTSKNSEAYTEFADSQIQIQLNEKSMIQIFRSRDQKSVNFIGGEIRVSNMAGGDESLVIRSGTQEISVAGSSEVKLAIPESDESGADETKSLVVLEVVSGQAEVKNLEEGSQSAEVVNAGQSLSFGVEKNDADEGNALAGNQMPETGGSEEKEDEPEIPFQVVKAGTERTVRRASEKFKSNTWEENGVKRRNFQFNIPMSDLTEKFRIIPRGALLEVEISGTPSAALRYFSIQIGTGEEGEWRRAHAFSWTNDGGYLAKGVPFDIKKPIALDHDIVNTDKSMMSISYEQGAEEIVVSDLKVKVSVVSLSGAHDTRAAESGFKKTLEYGSLNLFKDVWGGGANDFDYLIMVNADQIFGESVRIPAGSRVRISVSGTSSTEIEWFHPDLIYCEHDDWDNIICVNWDTYQQRFSENATPAGIPFAYSKSYELFRSMGNTNSGMFRFVVPGGAVSSAPTFTGLRITFEVL